MKLRRGSLYLERLEQRLTLSHSAALIALETGTLGPLPYQPFSPSHPLGCMKFRFREIRRPSVRWSGILFNCNSWMLLRPTLSNSARCRC